MIRGADDGLREAHRAKLTTRHARIARIRTPLQLGSSEELAPRHAHKEPNGAQLSNMS